MTPKEQHIARALQALEEAREALARAGAVQAARAARRAQTLARAVLYAPPKQRGPGYE